VCPVIGVVLIWSVLTSGLILECCHVIELVLTWSVLFKWSHCCCVLLLRWF